MQEPSQLPGTATTVRVHNRAAAAMLRRRSQPLTLGRSRGRQSLTLTISLKNPHRIFFPCASCSLDVI